MNIRNPLRARELITRFLGAVLLALIFTLPVAAANPLPSWRDGAIKSSITGFVARVTDSHGKDYVSPAERIAVFDNDGTLWAEQPMYFQVLFAFDRLRELAPKHPEWNDKPVLRAAIAGDMKGALAEGEKGLIDVVTLTHEGDIAAFRAEAGSWLMTARHPQSKRRYTEMVYQPMLELLVYLRANDFKTYIVSGGDVEFMRAFAERVYGVPPEQVIGSRLKLALQDDAVVRPADFALLNDGEEKVTSIANFIGRRPLLAFGNSDGDLAMLRWTLQGSGARFAGLVHHTDATREFAYDRASKVGKLNKALDAAPTLGIAVTDMARDWAVIYPAARP